MNFKTKQITLKSANPAQYGDLTVECKVIPNDQIGAYLKNIPETNKCVAYKSGHVHARKGIPGEVIVTTLYVEIDGKYYILSEETTTVSVRNGEVDWVVTNTSSTSNEQYVVKDATFKKTYEMAADTTVTPNGVEFVPTYEPRNLTRVDENIIIITAWHSEAICLRQSYVAEYNANENDYNTLNDKAKNKTYTDVQNGHQKRIQ